MAYMLPTSLPAALSPLGAVTMQLYCRKQSKSCDRGWQGCHAAQAPQVATRLTICGGAVPWIFAWTQTRFALPVWLGMGEAFEASTKP